MMQCDLVTGVCALPDAGDDAATDPQSVGAHPTFHYIGDPMCSWCWAISPALEAVAAFCAARDIGFSITVGGLRAGGGDAWNAAFRDFLRKEWQHVAAVSGQPFGFSLLDAPHFDYDTEPACRAVVTAQRLQARGDGPGSAVLPFFAAVQRKFYVDGQDPKIVDFYADICRSLNMDFDAFRRLFASPEAQAATQQAFVRCRQWGVRSFPTLALEREGRLQILANGFVTPEQAIALAEQVTADGAQR